MMLLNVEAIWAEVSTRDLLKILSVYIQEHNLVETDGGYVEQTWVVYSYSYCDPPPNLFWLSKHVCANQTKISLLKNTVSEIWHVLLSYYVYSVGDSQNNFLKGERINDKIFSLVILIIERHLIYKDVKYPKIF